MNNPVLYCALLDIRTLKSRWSRTAAIREGQRGMPWAVDSPAQPIVIISFHDNLPVFPGIDEAGLDGRVSVDIARKRLSTGSPWWTLAKLT